GVGTYFILPLALVYLITGRLYSDMTGSEWSRVYANPTFVTNFLLVCASFAPMLVISIDYGRQIVGIFVVSSTMVLSGLLTPSTFAVDRIRALNGNAVRAGLVGLLLLISLFTKTPECCLSDGGGVPYMNVVSGVVELVTSTFERPRE
ncbi:MAG: hypothetical protein WAW96_19515, partial [Alphaproteobacteria bacterium]